MSKKKMIAGLVLCAGAPVMAQVNDVAPQNDVNQIRPDRSIRFSTEALGDPIAGPYNVENGGNNGQLGVDHAFGHFWITARDSAATNHKVWKYDETGNFVKAFDQDPASKASAWGYRDGASDEVANQLYFGWDNGGFAVHDYDPATGDISVNCVETVAGVGTIRALARTPAGTFVTKSFGGTIYEFTSLGVQLNSWPDPGISAYGCAYDVASDTFWWHGFDGFVDETDRDMLLTGNFFDAAVSMTSFGAQGGLDIYAEPRSGTGTAFVALGQGAPDEIAIYEAVAGAAGLASTGPVGCSAPPPCTATEIAAMNVPSSLIDMDALAIGPTDVAALNAAGAPGPADLGRVELPDKSSTTPGVYNTNSFLGNALARVGGVVSIIEGASGTAPFDGVTYELTFNSPHTEFGFEVGDWNGPMNVDLYDGANLVGTMLTSTTAGGAAQKFIQIRGNNCTFDRVVIDTSTAGGNFVITQIWTQEPGGACPACACEFDPTGVPNVCNIFDFLAFQDGFVSGDPCAINFDPTGPPGIGNIFDFLAFQDSFVNGPCP